MTPISSRMRIAVVGEGGRENALRWSFERHGHEVVMVAVDAVEAFLDSLTTSPVDLVVPGPEQVLVDGLADRCRALGVPCFGPTADLARLESSKGYARDLATALGIPGPRFARFAGGQHAAAIDWWRSLGAPVVVKLDGLAAGKGVVVPEDDAATIVAIGATGGEFVLEERLHGPEVSLLALCDGERAVALPLAQDHKRIGEADTGPNTGGMGAIAPAPFDLDVEHLLDVFVRPILGHVAAAGAIYVGVLYAGLMMTVDGPRLIEYNVRFGDPEAQAVLPLVTSDLATLMLQATDGSMTAPPRISDAATCTVVVAAPGYPDRPTLGTPVEWADDLLVGRRLDTGTGAVLFPAGMMSAGMSSTSASSAGMSSASVSSAGRFSTGITTGGRVLAVTGIGPDLATARREAYAALDDVHLEGGLVRRDIGFRVPGARLGSYAAAGVDIDEGQRAVAAIRTAVERTHGPAVVAGLGGFGGTFSAAALVAMRDPLLVASTDGVGTKVELAVRAGDLTGIGADLVNHCINDVLVQGARPLFFLDYLASSALDADVVRQVVASMAAACEAAGCALLGGETAEMPGVYLPGAIDVAGTLVGVVERDDLLPRPEVAAGDVVIGLASSGPHTNGYSLIRPLVEWLPLDVVPSGFTTTLGEALLRPHRSYLDALTPALATGRIKALAHITGGGLPDNLPRILPEGVGARIALGSWPRSPLFALLADLAVGFDEVELHRTLNMGIGMVVVCAPGDADELRAAIDEPTWVIGELVAGRSGVALV